jgi:prepilin-type N-terminal cleavage/methylation domain-containing protein/prepilin-type processing-associated H-X9-DG protein
MKVRRGFTLIELLVVIAIIAILAAILFPVFAQARAAARKTSCLSNLKQLGTGMMMYTQDYDEKFPSWNWGFFCNGGNAGQARDSSAFWTAAILPYVKNTGVYRCPDDILTWNDAWANCSDDQGKKDPFGPYRPNGTICNFWETCNQNYVSYAMSEDLLGGNPTNKLAALQTPANWMMLTDGASQLADLWVWGAPDDSNKNQIVARAAFSSQSEGCCMMWDSGHNADYYIKTYGQAKTDASARHQGGNNVAYADGHAKWTRWTNLTWGKLTTGLQ